VKRRTLLFLWLPPLFYLALIFTLSGMSQPPVPTIVPGNYLHYPEYAVLSFLLARAIQGAGREIPGASLLAAAFGLAVLFAAADEVRQAFVPGRIPDVADWVRDCFGAAVGAAAWRFWRHLSS
jgi:VanZ family protein